MKEQDSEYLGTTIESYKTVTKIVSKSNGNAIIEAYCKKRR